MKTFEELLKSGGSVSFKVGSIKDFANKAFNITPEEGKCNWCKQDLKGFRDDLSVKEYEISGFCQSCQDKTFN